MKQKLLTLGLALVSLAMLLIPIAMPSLAFAAHNSLKANVFDPAILAGPLLLCTGAPSSGGGGAISNTCQNLCDLVAQIAQIIYYMIAVVIWIITPILIAVGGIMIMLGGASPEMIGRGKKTITGAVWGIVIVLCAWLIVFTFVSAFGGLSKYVGGFGGNAGCIATGSTNTNTTDPNYGFGNLL
jgi:hypothetical protein